jgi:hypothetical protein
MKKRILLIVAAAVASVSFYVLVAEYPPWGKPAGYVRKRPQWENKPTLQLSMAERANVLTKLLEDNRAEIRFWQDHLFTISFLFSAAVLGIVTFALQTTTNTRLIRYVCAVGCFSLVIFYLLFVRFAEDAISLNDHDLIGIQYALRLSTPGEYLQEDRVIYVEGYPAGHSHIKHFVRFNVLLVIGSIILLLYLALRQEQCNRNKEESKQSDAQNTA